VLEQEKAARAGLEEALRKLSELTPESLVRTDELGTSLDFSEGVEVFRRTLALFESLRHCNLDNVPVNILDQLSQVATQAAQTFEQIQRFDPSGQNNPAGVRDGLIKQVADQYQGFFQHISPVVAYSVRKGTDFDRLERDARTALEEINRLRGEIEQQRTEIVGQAQSALEQVQRVAAQVGVAQHAVHFREEAAEHLRRSRYWLWATAGLGLATAGFGAWSLYYYATEGISLTTAQSVQLAISKLVVFSILYLAAIWSGRTYRAQWHNYVINKHRQNALSTFETFVKAAGDDQTKNAVLLQATQSIFSPQSSGFVGTEGDGPQSPQILEIIRSVVGTRGGDQ
jgi:hypothetical protein